MQLDEDRLCYFDENGCMAFGECLEHGGWYYYDEKTGAQCRGPVVLPDGRQVFYSLTNGKMLYGKQTICGTSFTFNTVNGSRSSGPDGLFWLEWGGKRYWFESWKRQGYNPYDSSYRGKEIYDPASDAWYWLDNIQNGAMAASKDVYQESDGGKWVRYDENGHMVKGWDVNENGTYYFDQITGAMAKGALLLDDVQYGFDPIMGTMLDCQWLHTEVGDYWYEGGIRQGTEGRGKEIYDPDSDAWYWLDADRGGAKAVSKDVYQESNGGKWVRYDANGHMIKGWDTNDDGTYYFDLVTGAMTKGDATIDGLPCSFDTVTGIGLNCAWKHINGKDYWYEGGKRQGYDPNNAAYRGKEIYDPASDAWYWLDNVQQGAKTINKDVYQESEAGDWAENADGTGKWVRYDANGHMVKGWDTNNDGTYYFDQVYGTMAKGIVTIDGNLYLFDVDTGVMQASITTSEEAMADRVIELVNQERTSRGLQPLVKDDRLMVAAAARAKELSQRYSHTRPNGSECFTILWHLGIDYGYAGENIAMGQRTPEIVMNDWMNSSGHRANILNENYDCIGVGYTMVDGHPYWVQLFTGDFDL